MDRQPDILKHRIQVPALSRRRHQPRKGIGGQQDEECECRRDPGLHRKHIRLQRLRQVSAEESDHRGKEDEDQQPQEHRAFVISPDPGDLVDQRLKGMRVLPYVLDREIRRHISECQHGEGECDQQKADERRVCSKRHQGGIAAPYPDDGQEALDDRGRERQDQRVMPEFDDHRMFSSPPSVTPWALRRSATSFGM